MDPSSSSLIGCGHISRPQGNLRCLFWGQGCARCRFLPSRSFNPFSGCSHMRNGGWFISIIIISIKFQEWQPYLNALVNLLNYCLMWNRNIVVIIVKLWCLTCLGSTISDPSNITVTKDLLCSAVLTEPEALFLYAWNVVSQGVLWKCCQVLIL